MGDGNLIAVSDAGPLIHLAEVNCLAFLDLFTRLHIPELVWSEIIRQPQITNTDFTMVSNIQRHDLSRAAVAEFVAENRLKELHSGEQECLCLGRQIGVSILLTDDLAAREIAKRLGLRPLGSLGIVVRAYRLRRITLGDAEHKLVELYDKSSLFVTRAIVELAIEQLHQR
ncbi:hypothetical protein ANRL1_04345 [Anaerolineae bacterium]|nr:hypothetical protein ANRL1_04345 [Anaerolineae bacterium]